MYLVALGPLVGPPGRASPPPVEVAALQGDLSEAEWLSRAGMTVGERGQWMFTASLNTAESNEQGQEMWRTAALRVLNLGLAQHPKSALLHNAVGALMIARPEAYEVARGHFCAAQEISPRWQPPYLNEALLERKHGGSAEYIASRLEHALALDPANFPAWGDLLEALSELPGREDDAVALAEKCVAQDPRNVESLRNLALTLSRRDPSDPRVEQVIRSAWALAPGDPAVFAMLLGHLLENPERSDEAVQLAEDNEHQFTAFAEIQILIARAKGAAEQAPEAQEIHLKRAVELVPASDEAWFLLATLYRNWDGKSELAKAAYLHSANLCATDAVSYLNLAELELLEGGSLDQAIVYFDLALKRNPDYPTAICRRLEAGWMKSGWTPQMRVEALRLLDRAKVDTDFREPLWRFLANTSDAEMLQHLLARAAADFPDDAELWTLLASIYFRLDQFSPDGLAVAKKALRLDPLSPRANLWAGLYYGSNRQTSAEAIPCLTYFVQEEDGYVLPHMALGKAYLFLPEWDPVGREHLDTALEMDPTIGEIYNLRAAAYVRESNWPLAVIDAQIALELGYEDKQTRVSLFEGKMHMGDYSPELDDYTAKWMAEDPNDLEYRSFRTIFLQYAGRFDEAYKEVVEFGERWPNNQYVWRLRADLLRTMGRWEDSIEWARTIVADPSVSSSDFRNAGELSLLLGNLKGARVDLETAYRINPLDSVTLQQLVRIALHEHREKQAWEYVTAMSQLSPMTPYIKSFAYSVSVRLGRVKDLPAALQPEVDSDGVPFQYMHDVASGVWREGKWAAADLQIGRAFSRMTTEEAAKSYGAIFRWVAAARASRSLGAAWLPHYESVAPDEWQRMVLRFLQGKIGKDEFLSLSKVGSRFETRGKTFEAHYYMGVVAELSGQNEEALSHYRWCVEHPVVEFIECLMAQDDFARLEKKLR